MRAGFTGRSTSGRAGCCLLSTACRGVTHSHVSNNNPFRHIFHTGNAEEGVITAYFLPFPSPTGPIAWERSELVLPYAIPHATVSPKQYGHANRPTRSELIGDSTSSNNKYKPKANPCPCLSTPYLDFFDKHEAGLVLKIQSPTPARMRDVYATCCYREVTRPR